MARVSGRGLGLGLGLARPQRRAFRKAVRRGELPSFFEENAYAQEMFDKAYAGGGLNARRASRMAARGGYTFPSDSMMSPPPDPNAGPKPPGPPAPTWQDIIKKYEVAAPPEYDAVSELARASAARAGSMHLPSYEEMFQRYRDVGEREAGRQAAAINDAFGSRGARYSSDLLTAQGDMRKALFQDLMKYSSEAQLGLNQQRLQELGGAANMLTTIGSNRANIAENAAGRAMTDWLRSTSPNPLLEALFNYATSFQPPGTIVY